MSSKPFVFAAIVCSGLAATSACAQAPQSQQPSQPPQNTQALPRANQPTVVVQQPPIVEYVPAPPAIVYLQAPVVNIGRRHGNLRNAQGFIVEAFQEVSNAQAANDGQLGGHAQRAKELLIQADAELRQAANVSNAEGR